MKNTHFTIETTYLLWGCTYGCIGSTGFGGCITGVATATGAATGTGTGVATAIGAGADGAVAPRTGISGSSLTVMML